MLMKEVGKPGLKLAAWNICCSRLESNEDKAVDGEDERRGAMETGC